MSTEFIKIIGDRLSGRAYNTHKYISTIDEIIRRVYNNRYKGVLSAGDLEEKRSNPGSKRLQVTVSTDSTRGFSVVNFETFENVCWDELEENSLLSRLGTFTFNDDGSLYRHIQVTFENILQKMIFDLEPGFETRKKQVYRVLKASCIEVRRNNRRYWKLGDLELGDPEPASLEKLLLISQSFANPKIRISKPGSRIGPSIKDIDMKEYLLNILKVAGGMAAYNDILSLVKIRLGIKTINEILVRLQNDSEGKEGGNAEERKVTRLVFEKPGYLLGADYILMANEIVQYMNAELKSIYYQRFIQEKKLEAIAKDMHSDTTSVFNKIEKLKDYLRRYFRSPDHQAITEEQKAVIELVSVLIEKERS
jgi:hypothetical protein